MESVVDFRLYLVTDRAVVGKRTFAGAVREALEGGVRAVQLREKDLEGRELLRTARQLRELTAGFGAKLFVNDRADVALASGADGVHLGQSSFSPTDVKPYLAEEMMVGVSTHSLAEALEAEAAGADFVTFGPVYHTPSKASYGEPVGVDRLREAATGLSIPVFAIGGVKKGALGEISDAGAYGAAVISEILNKGDIRGNVTAFMDALNREFKTEAC